MAEYRLRNKQILVSAPFDINNQLLENVAYPLSDTDGASKLYADTIINTIGINYATQTGLYSGGTMTISGDTSFNLLAGIGYFVDPTTKIITKIEWNDDIDIPAMVFGPTDITISVGIDSNGDVFQQIPKFTTEQRRYYIILGELFIHPTLRILVDSAYNPIFSWDIPSVVDMHLSENPRVIQGNTISPNGANMSMDATSGKMSGYSINAKQDLDSPNESSQIAVTGFSWFPSFYDSTEWVYTGSTNVIDPSVWSNGTAVLQSSTPSKYNLRVVFRSTGIGDVFFLVLPPQTGEYANIAEAEADILLLGVPQPSELFGITIPVSWVIVRGDATELNDPNDGKFVPITSVSTASGAVATNATDVSYDPTGTANIISTNVQGALDEVNDKIEDLDYSFNNQNMTVLSGTSGIYLATNDTITDVPTSRVRVMLNAIEVEVGNGVTLSDCFFSDDGGSTPKTWANVAQDDELYWNGDQAPYQLETNDSLDFIYMTW